MSLVISEQMLGPQNRAPGPQGSSGTDTGSADHTMEISGYKLVQNTASHQIQELDKEHLERPDVVRVHAVDDVSCQ